MKFTVIVLLVLGMLASAYTFRDRISGWSSRFESNAQDIVSNEQVVLQADNHSGKAAAWEKRYYYGKHTWGIRGSGSPEEGEIWFDAFPGDTGRYKVTLGAIFEADGSPYFSVSAGDTTLYDGRLPYHGGKKDCDARGAAQQLDLGEHQITKGSRISLWAKSVYECGEKGAYLLWHELRFERVAS